MVWAKIVFEQLCGRNYEGLIVDSIRSLDKDKELATYLNEIVDNLFCKQIVEFKNLKENSERIIPLS